MKKLLSIALCATAVSAFGNDATLGTVGVTAISSTLTNTIVAVSYDDLALASGSGIAVSNFVKTTNLTKGDQLAVFTNGVYSTWRLEQVGDTGPKYWAKNEKEFTVDSDGKLEQGTGSAASDVTQAVGTGIWLIRQNPTDGSGNAKPFYIYGKPSTAMTITTKSGVWNLVGNPTQGDVPITAAIVPGANNDEIRVPGKNGLVNYLYKTGANKGKGGWCRAAGATGQLESAPTIKAGMGFWVKTVSAVEINWKDEGTSI